MSSPLDNLNILVVLDSSKDIIYFLKVDYFKLINLLDLSTLDKTEYLSFTFLNILNLSILEQTQVYINHDLILVISDSFLKNRCTDICTFIDKPFIQIRI